MKTGGSRPQCRKEYGPQGSQMSSDVRAKMRAERAAAALHQDLEIASGLRRLDRTKRVFPSRHRHINGVIARNLQEHSCIRAAFVGLSR